MRISRLASMPMTAAGSVTAVTDGSFTLTAANGDTLTGTYRGRVSPTATQPSSRSLIPG